MGSWWGRRACRWGVYVVGKYGRIHRVAHKVRKIARIIRRFASNYQVDPNQLIALRIALPFHLATLAGFADLTAPAAPAAPAVLVATTDQYIALH